MEVDLSDKFGVLPLKFCGFHPPRPEGTRLTTPLRIYSLEFPASLVLQGENFSFESTAKAKKPCTEYFSYFGIHKVSLN